MRFARRLLPSGLLAVIVACGSETVLEPGALTITLNGPPPSLTSVAALPITGQVVRTPTASGATIVVTASGGANAASDTVAADGSFVVTVGLSLNTTNQIQFSASDASGSAVTPVSLVIRHDNTPAGVASSTPAHEADAVTSGTFAVVFTEPVRPGTATIGITQQGVAVPGVSNLSADSLTLTFTPNVPFAPNAIHNALISGQDEAGNPSAGAARCFVTGGTAVSSVSDPEDDAFVTQTPPTAALVPLDLLEMRFARTTDALYTIVRFDAPRSLLLSASNNVTGVIDFDMDQNGSTGFIPLKDARLGAAIGDSSGAGADYLIELGDWIGTDSAFVGQYTSQTSVSGAAFVASTCGGAVGWAAPLALLGGPDDSFDVVAYFDTFDAVGAYADAAPDLGVYSVAFTSAAAVSPGTPGLSGSVPVPLTVSARRINRFQRRR